MDSMVLECTSCGSRLKLQGQLSPGKEVTCPKCQGKIIVPEIQVHAEEAPPEVVAMSRRPRPKRDVEDDDDYDRPRRRRQRDTELNGAENFVGLIPVLGLVIGGAWAAGKNPKAASMLKLSFLSTFIVAIAGAVTWFYYINPPDQYASGPRAPEQQASADRDDEDSRSRRRDAERDRERDRNRRPGPGMMPGGTGPNKDFIESQPPLIRRTLRANVKIFSGTGFGSGVILERVAGTDNVLVVTNHHVVAAHHDSEDDSSLSETDVSKMPELRVQFSDTTTTSGKVVWLGPDRIDLAIVLVKAPKDLEPAPWRKVAPPSALASLFAVGNPLGQDWSMAPGGFSTTRVQSFGTHQVKIIQHTVPINPGNSGGGLYNERGELVGINTSMIKLEIAQGIGFAIPITLLDELKPKMLGLAANAANSLPADFDLAKARIAPPVKETPEGNKAEKDSTKSAEKNTPPAKSDPKTDGKKGKEEKPADKKDDKKNEKKDKKA